MFQKRESPIESYQALSDFLQQEIERIEKKCEEIRKKTPADKNVLVMAGFNLSLNMLLIELRNLKQRVDKAILWEIPLEAFKSNKEFDESFESYLNHHKNCLTSLEDKLNKDIPYIIDPITDKKKS